MRGENVSVDAPISEMYFMPLQQVRKLKILYLSTLKSNPHTLITNNYFT
jgi:hypothetical protein